MSVVGSTPECNATLEYSIDQCSINNLENKCKFYSAGACHCILNIMTCGSYERTADHQDTYNPKSVNRPNYNYRMRRSLKSLVKYEICNEAPKVFLDSYLIL